MCGLCGLLNDAPQWSDPLQQQALPARQRRLQQLAVLNRALAPFRLRLSDVHGSAWLLSSPTGQQQIINRLEQLWVEAERLLKQPIDPLDSHYLAALAPLEAR
ncbi:hypothetical protein Z042_01015 [Chania multitudinisentens RB-25]|uniref:Uncharacterized protein n=1 Tax=Chania multitudinisentens RB-25 TaxID=1441930 RepID=W0L3S4_9GAMM|nr:hypothetical protein [Chania multitudinisentens]AHG18383.1 hypothetical protein Z042_01015 [Chania multitudinisentens RB-25]